MNDTDDPVSTPAKCYVLSLQGAAGADRIPLAADNDADALTSALRVLRGSLPQRSPDDEVQIVRPDRTTIPGRYTVRTLTTG